ncbi:hypothetical protein C8Q74DRAFT_1218965 [Fomes fomentarius]|nr:hypothetical protein C8Q74DRAFT_1218965 [Fomes fomentarius]
MSPSPPPSPLPSPLPPSPPVWFTLLVIGFSLIIRNFSDACTPALAHTHTPITHGGVIYAVGTLSHANCAHCLADKCEREAAVATTARAHVAQDILASTLPPYWPSLPPTPLLPLPGLVLTDLDGPWASPTSSLPGYQAATAYLHLDVPAQQVTFRPKCRLAPSLFDDHHDHSYYCAAPPSGGGAEAITMAEHDMDGRWGHADCLLLVVRTRGWRCVPTYSSTYFCNLECGKKKKKGRYEVVHPGVVRRWGTRSNGMGSIHRRRALYHPRRVKGPAAQADDDTPRYDRGVVFYAGTVMWMSNGIQYGGPRGGMIAHIPGTHCRLSVPLASSFLQGQSQSSHSLEAPALRLQIHDFERGQ